MMLQKVLELGDVNLSTSGVCAGGELLVWGRDHEHAIWLRDPLGFSHQISRIVQILYHPEDDHDVEVIFGKR